jgi:hypothetical protein
MQVRTRPHSAQFGVLERRFVQRKPCTDSTDQDSRPRDRDTHLEERRRSFFSSISSPTYSHLKRLGRGLPRPRAPHPSASCGYTCPQLSAPMQPRRTLGHLDPVLAAVLNHAVGAVGAAWGCARLSLHDGLSPSRVSHAQVRIERTAERDLDAKAAVLAAGMRLLGVDASASEAPTASAAASRSVSLGPPVRSDKAARLRRRAAHCSCLQSSATSSAVEFVGRSRTARSALPSAPVSTRLRAQIRIAHPRRHSSRMHWRWRGPPSTTAKCTGVRRAEPTASSCSRGCLSSSTTVSTCLGLC